MKDPELKELVNNTVKQQVLNETKNRFKEEFSELKEKISTLIKNNNFDNKLDVSQYYYNDKLYIEINYINTLSVFFKNHNWYGCLKTSSFKQSTVFTHSLYDDKYETYFKIKNHLSNYEKLTKDYNDCKARLTIEYSVNFEKNYRKYLDPSLNVLKKDFNPEDYRNMNLNYTLDFIKNKLPKWHDKFPVLYRTISIEIIKDSMTYGNITISDYQISFEDVLSTHEFIEKQLELNTLNKLN